MRLKVTDNFAQGRALDQFLLKTLSSKVFCAGNFPTAICRRVCWVDAGPCLFVLPYLSGVQHTLFRENRARGRETSLATRPAKKGLITGAFFFFLALSRSQINKIVYNFLQIQSYSSI